MPPKVIAKPDRPSGVLPINAAQRAPTSNKPSGPRLKLEVRRLPPGLTLTEFEETLGPDWKLHGGKVDWREYRTGKLKAPGKLPEQSRCYLHVVNEAAVKEFEQRFLGVVFHDKAGTYKHNDLKGLPPTLGFAPNQRTPLGAKQRADNRQGTIDQDPEFIAFLEAETQPVVKAVGPEGEKEEVVAEKVKTTPLIEDLREKKARKDKAAASKAEKKKGKAADGKEEKEGGGKVEGKEDKAQQQKVEQAAKEAAKVLNKQAASKAAQQSKTNTPAGTAAPATARSKKPAQAPKQQNASPAAPASPAAARPDSAAGPRSPAPQRGPPAQRQRGNADGIKKMLQKDLGIRPKAAAPSPTTPASPASSTSSPAPASPAQNTKPTPQPQPTPSTNKSTPSTPAPANPSTTKAYLKHANPSQGMTEILIQQALSQFGEMANVTIDPRKGTAIAVFKDQEGLKKAMGAKRVPVAQGVVEVLEFRERGPTAAGQGGGRGGGGGGFRGGRGGRGRGGGATGAAGGAGTAAGASAAPQAQAPAPSGS